MSAITCGFGAGPMSIRPCSDDHGYDSHDMLGGPAFWRCKTLWPRESRGPHTFQVSPEASDRRLTLTPSRVGHFWLPQRSCCYCLQARTYYLGT